MAPPSPANFPPPISVSAGAFDAGMTLENPAVLDPLGERH